MAAAVPDYLTASDATLEPYVNHFFQYERWADHVGADGQASLFGSHYWNSNNNYDWRIGYRLGSRYRVVEEIAQGAGCSSCSGGQGTYKFEYTGNYGGAGWPDPVIGYQSLEHNSWAMKTTEYLPGPGPYWGDHDRRVTYTNELGQTILSVFVEMDGPSWLVDAMSMHESEYNNTVTVTVPGHSFQTGDRVAFAGVLPTLYNGIFPVTRIDADTFTFQLPWRYFSAQTEYSIKPDAYIHQVVGGETIVTTVTKVGAEWATYSRYDNRGRVILQAAPSAINGYDDANPGLLRDAWGNYPYLNDHDGLIQTYEYYTSTTATASVAGGVAGFLRASFVQQGKAGTPIVQQVSTYYAHTAGDATVHRLATETVFGLDHGTASNFSDRDPRTTTYTYTLFTGTTRIESLTVAAPVVSAAQNGPNNVDLTTTVFDTHGRPTWVRDGDGFLHHFAYDTLTGALTKQIVDVDTTQTSDFTALPTGWSTPSGGGWHLITTTEVDGLGRTVQQVDPAGTVTWFVYNDAQHEVRVYRGWDSINHTATGPIEIRREYRPAPSAPVGEREVYYEVLIIHATPTYDSLTGAPTGQETFNAGMIQGLQREITNSGGQIVESLLYFSMAGLTYATANPRLGTASNDSATGNYHQITYGFDHRGRPGRVQDATGTITRTVYDGLGRVTGVWIGTDDTGATATNPAGTGSPNNMILVQTYEYDHGAIGDGNLTQITAFPGGGATPRVTEFAYDWRNRLVATKAGVETTEDTATNRPITFYTLDNLGAITAIAVYDGDDVALSTTAPSASLLRAYTKFHYDAQSRVYRTEQFSVDPTSGAISTHALTTDTWYNRRGQVVKVAEPGGLVTKTGYDGAGRLIVVWQADGGGDTTWLDAFDVDDDIVLTQTTFTYDANSNLILVTTRERFHDNSAGATGVLGTPTTGNLARVSYVAYYYDDANRLVALVDVGTHGGAAYTRPGTVPGRSDTVRVTSYTYDAGGRVETITDPSGRVTHFITDKLGRTIRAVEAYTDGVPTATTNKRVEYTYDGIGNVLTLKVALPGSAQQTTGYVYGVDDIIARNDLLAEVRHPDKTTGAPSATEAETFSYNALGQVLTTTDRNGTTHTLTYNVLGRLAADAATTLGTGIAGDVRRRETAYDVLGRPTLLSSYDAVSGGNVVNQIQRDYNGLGQLVTEYQAHAGAVDTGTTPKVQYASSEMAAGANHSRLTRLIYPDGRILHHGYAGGLDDAISRTTYLADDDGLGDPGQVLEQYDYLGLGRLVTRARPEPGIALTYVKRSGEPDGDAGDQYTGLDRFGRVVDQRWLDPTTGTANDRYAYGHDRVGNRLYRANLLDSALDELYTYDETNQLASFARGELSDTTMDGIFDTVANPSRTQDWTFDALGNWEELDTNGTPESRSHNAQNQLTEVGTASLTYDANGNLTTDETGRTFTYDAWNRLVEVADSGSAVLVTYTYDALNRRITADDGTERAFYHSAAWQVLEERVTGSDDAQYVWSLAYVDALVLRDQGTERLYAQQDANWNVTALVDDAGVVVERYVYDPYGAVTILAGDWSARGSSAYDWVHLHQGGRYDEASDLYHFRNRDYSATLGRWTRTDPIGFEAGDANLYRYVLNGPINFTDPNGLVNIPAWVKDLPGLELRPGQVIEEILTIPHPDFGHPPGKDGRPVPPHFDIWVRDNCGNEVSWRFHKDGTPFTPQEMENVTVEPDELRNRDKDKRRERLERKKGGGGSSKRQPPKRWYERIPSFPSIPKLGPWPIIIVPEQLWPGANPGFACDSSNDSDEAIS